MVKVTKLDGTPVKINAFAFGDYDDKAILSRKFFSDLNLPTDMTDAEILKSLNISTPELAEKATAILLKMRETVKKYSERLQNHARKLEDLGKKIAFRIVEDGENKKLRKTFKAANFLSKFYSRVSTNDIKGLYYEIQEKLYMCDAVIGSRYRKILAQRLKQARKEMKITQVELAEKIGMTQGGYTSYEQARSEPPLATLVKLSKVLNKSTDWLLGA